MRQVYYPENVGTWEDALQSGGALPFYAVQPYQRGHGIGSFFRGLFRAIWPTVRKVAPRVGKELLRTGTEIASDVIRRDQEVMPTLKRRGRQAVGRALTTVGEKLQEGEGIGTRTARKTIKRVKPRGKSKPKRARLDALGNY